MVFTPQIVENFRRSSAEGLSLTFLLVWLVGDIFNIVGAVLQGVLPTMIILAVYYTLADIVLLLQCFYYRGFSLMDDLSPSKAIPEDEEPNENAPLLSHPDRSQRPTSPLHRVAMERSLSNYSSYSGVDGTHLSPATPLLSAGDDPPAARNFRPMSTLQSVIFNITALVLVCAAGAFGWWLSVAPHRHSRDHGRYNSNSGGGAGTSDSDEMDFDVLGQVFGYLCAVFYLGSRLPQLLLNYRRKSTEGVSILFFLFACIGNLTYVLSILAFDPVCTNGHRDHHPGRHGDDGYATTALFGHGSRHNECGNGEWWDRYSWYMLVNLSWLIGSAGTLGMDFAIFVQFWVYKGNEPVRE